MTACPATSSQSTGFSTQRLHALDLARGLALVAMASYHLSWDLSWFGVVDWPVGEDEGWKTYARLIAGTFLFLAGISLTLAHGQGIRWRAFWRREAVIIAAAAAVSVGTWYALGSNMVRFGILHCIATASLIALPFVRLPALVSLAAALLVFSLPFWAAGPAFDGPIWLWSGLGDPGLSSVDWVPLVPWAGAALLGVAAGHLLRQPDIKATASRWKPNSGISRLLCCGGRHSLAVYLIHQPVLFGTLWLVAATGLIEDRVSRDFQENCTLTCTGGGVEQQACERICGCTLTAMKSDGLWDKLLGNPEDTGLMSQMNTSHAMCVQREFEANPPR
jgi:uncharacterized membrane protein